MFVVIYKKSNFLWRGSPIGGLSLVLKKNFGRNNRGKITIRHRKSPLAGLRLRLINHKIFSLKNEFAQVVRFERDPSRSGFIALVRLLRSGFLCYLPAHTSSRIGSIISINPDTVLNKYLRAKLSITSLADRLINIKKGSFISNIESNGRSGSKFCRSAGCKSKLQGIHPRSGLASVLLPSGKSVLVPLSAHAFVGTISNPFNYLRKYYKAGQLSYVGRRPKVRGVAMNPVDHPHGGGEGKTSGGRPSVSPWGVLTKGFKTVSNVKVRNRVKLKNKHRLLLKSI